MNQAASDPINSITQASKNHCRDQYSLLDLYDTYAPVLFGLVCKILPQQSHAEDVMEELFQNLPGYIDQHDEKRSSLQNWLMNKARILAVGKLYNVCGNSQSVERLDSLSVMEKTVFVLHHYSGCTANKIGSLLGLPANLVDIVLKKATGKLEQTTVVFENA
ncbi:hypothetical protein BH10BAC3_BH10BAC3_17410 [soil metagenome]